jgi:probable HAF family extracellular repeat protein
MSALVSRRHPTFRRRPLALALALALGSSAHTQAADGLTNMGAPAALDGATGLTVRPADVADDGMTVVGNGFGRKGEDFIDVGYRWSPSDGFTDPAPNLPANDRASAYGVSDDGAVVVGDYTLPGTFDTRGYRLAGSTVETINPDLGGDYVRVSGVSGDGRVVVGYTGSGSVIKAYRWVDGTMSNLGELASGRGGQAFATNSDGSVVVGLANVSASEFHAFRWTGGTMSDLGRLGTSGNSSALGVSADGSVVVGTSSRASDGAYDHAFRWTQSGGMVDLHDRDGDFSTANAVSGDGKVVVGGVAATAGALLPTAFRWTQASGMQTVEEWLSANGVAVGSGVETQEATATNSNGSVVVGVLRSGEAFLARVGEGSGATGGGDSGGGTDTGGGGSGMVTFADIVDGIGWTSNAASSTTRTVVVALQGAHSRPLSRLTAPGSNTLWVAGDWGEDTHARRDGDVSLAEIGGGHHFGDFQFNLSAGHTWASQDAGALGKSTADGYYLLAEWLAPVLKRDSDALWAVASGFHQWGDGRTRRGYLNAGLADSSFGEPDSRNWGASLRLEWDRLLHCSWLSANPFVEYAHIESSLDAYTETGGGFPARIGASNDSFDQIRYGLNAEAPVNEWAKLVAIIEGAHRFDGQGPASSATLLGPGGFTVSTAGARVEQDWLRVGGGVEAQVGRGTASVMVNGTTEGEMPAYWVAASWRMSF